MSIGNFWEVIDQQVEELKTAKSADDVVKVLNSFSAPSSGDAFFAGSGGDGSVFGSLSEAGWTTVWYEAHYYWKMRAPDGSTIEYVEGDIYARGTDE